MHPPACVHRLGAISSFSDLWGVGATWRAAAVTEGERKIMRKIMRKERTINRWRGQ